ncbi:threonine/serine dehydratase [Wenzhouxiangella sp. XN79A]|uniref:threonine ammonia-lyase n=1 Tax=Wenzhouxiangella sp. XN79A TaxID=2724193 RepID=UPI00144A8F58|nr:threonine/serine dehydratase [Wenzhouxiangella sp. XN79A]NKI35297.1 threonine/serine dehydratase [Wenzhouxiangella sp. XN79A]
MAVVPDIALPSPLRAAARLSGVVRRTPVLLEPALDAQLGCRLHFKAEHLQVTGSFKYRGASNALARLDDGIRGVATHSSGNHGAALAAAARARGLEAHVVMPENAVRTKIEAVRAHGGQVHFCAPNQAAREAGLADWVDRGFVAIPPYDHDDIIAGQGTLALELLEQVEALDCIVAPIGGGGMLAGIVRAVAERAPDVQVIGAEPLGADDAQRSLAAGRRVEDHHPQTIADGLRALLGQRNFAILSAADVPILTVSEDGIRSAMGLLWHRLKQVIEPSGAVALAAVAAHSERFAGQRVGVVLSGGNLDTDALLAHLPPA